jgi:hypothetical protein
LVEEDWIAQKGAFLRMYLRRHNGAPGAETLTELFGDNPHGGGGPDPGEGVDHQPNQRPVAQVKLDSTSITWRSSLCNLLQNCRSHSR